MNASVQHDLEEVFNQYGYDGSQALQPSHILHTSNTWNSDVPPSSSLDASAFDDPLSFLMAPMGDSVPEDDEDADFPRFISATSLLSYQQQNVIGPPVLTAVSTIADVAEDGEPAAMAYPEDISNPWINPEYQPLIKWVVAAADTELVKPFKATVPAHVKPASWKDFRADDAECKVLLTKDRGKEAETRLVLDAKNIFMYMRGDDKKWQKRWVYMCPNCERLGHAKAGKDPGYEQFNSEPRTLPKRQYLYTCSSCSFSHQNFRANLLIELAMTKADQLGMDIFEYFLGDYDHVVDQMKNISNLEEVEQDRYTSKVMQTRRENLEPFMGCRFLAPESKEKTKTAVSMTIPGASPSTFPMPFGGTAKPPPKRPVGAYATKGARKARKQKSATEVNVIMNKTQLLYPELRFWTVLNKKFKSEIDSGTLTKEVFDRMIDCRDGFCEGVDTGLFSSQKGDRFSVQDGEMNKYDYLLRNCNKAIARLFSDPDLVSPELKDDCIDALGFGDEEIAALLSKPLPSAQPADRSEQVLRIVTGTGDKLNTLRQAAFQVASPAMVDGAFTPSPTAELGRGTFAARKSPLGVSTVSHQISHQVPHHFKPVGESLAAAREIMHPKENGGLAPDKASLCATLIMCGPILECENCKSNGIDPVPSGPTMTKCNCGSYFEGVEKDENNRSSSGGGTSNNKTMKCICGVPPSDSDEIIQCSLCKQWSHRVCYSIDTTDDIKDWCCKHCKPAVYQSIAISDSTECPLKGLTNRLPCMCNDHYPLPFAAGTDIDYDDTNWLQCSVVSCGRLMHSKCYHPFECGKVHVLCPTCQEEDDEDDDD